VRIFQVIPEYVRGGGELMARNLHAGALAQGHDSTLVVLSPKQVPTNETTVSLDGMGPRDLTTVLALHRMLVGCARAIVHTHMYSAQLVGAMLPRGSARMVTTEHSTYNRRRDWPGFRWIDRKMYQRYHRIVAISEPVAEALRDWCGEMAPRLVTIHNGVNTSAIRFVADAPASVRLVSVGRLEAVKNLGLAISAVSTLIDRGHDIVYDIFGEGSLHAQLDALVAARKHVGRIRLLGWSDKIGYCLGDYSAVIVPSLWEGFGLAAIEGMAAGLPVFCSNIRGLADTVAGGPGILFEPRSQEDLVAALDKAIGSGLLRQAPVRHAAREHAIRYDFSTTMRKYLDLYQDVEGA